MKVGNNDNTNNSNLYSKVAYALMGLTGAMGIREAVNLIPHASEVKRQQEIDAMHSPKSLIDNRMETEWKWINGGGATWLAERGVNIKDALGTFEQYQEYESPHWMEGPSERAGSNSFGIIYLKQLKELEEALPESSPSKSLSKKIADEICAGKPSDPGVSLEIAGELNKLYASLIKARYESENPNQSPEAAGEIVALHAQRD